MILHEVTDKLFKLLLNGKIAVGNAKKLDGKGADEFAESDHTHTKSEVGLGNVDNTADSAKSVKYATSAGSATTATKATQDASGNVITSTYKTKAESKNILFTEDESTAPSDSAALWAHL